MCRHYILNFLWILINLLCTVITLYHLVKLYRDYSTTSAESVRQAFKNTQSLKKALSK